MPFVKGLTHIYRFLLFALDFIGAALLQNIINKILPVFGKGPKFFLHKGSLRYLLSDRIIFRLKVSNFTKGTDLKTNKKKLVLSIFSPLFTDLC